MTPPTDGSWEHQCEVSVLQDAAVAVKQANLERVVVNARVLDLVEGATDVTAGDRTGVRLHEGQACVVLQELHEVPACAVAAYLHGAAGAIWGELTQVWS